METFWIVGAGHFGLRALWKLSENHKNRRFVLVDPIKEHLERAKGQHRTLEQGDGVAFLNENLRVGNEPDWIIPALPVHLAAEWCLLRLGSDRYCRTVLPSEIDPLLPNPIRGASRDIYVSHATFRCPEDCAEPRNVCTVTREPRKQNMFDLLGELRLPGFQCLVIRSRQLGTGVGGYRPRHLFDLLTQMENAKTNMLICTACRCHGVVTGVQNPESSSCPDRPKQEQKKYL